MTSEQLTPAILFPSNIQVNPLKLESNQLALKTFHRVIQTCIGPQGKLKMIQNACGGHVTVTSNSSRLFQTLSISNPFVRLIVSAVRSSLTVLSDGGLFTSLMILFLLERSLKLSFSKSLICDLLTYFSQLCTSYFASFECTCKIRINFDNITHLKSVVETILFSKPGCFFSLDEKNYISLQILQAFLNCIPSPGTVSQKIGRVYFLTQEGPSALESKVLSGFATECPSSLQSQDNVILQKLFAKSYNLSKIKVVLFTASLAGDIKFCVPHLEVPEGFNIWDHILNTLKQVGLFMINTGVDIVACQKVVHPLLRKHLEDQNIVVIERLGFQATQYLQYISGAIPVESITISNWDTVFGYLHYVQFATLGKKNYLVLQNEDRALWTIFLCNRNEEVLEETKMVCKQALDALYRLLEKPEAVFGGGCTEIAFAAFLEDRVRRELPEIASKTRCLESQVLEVLGVMKECLYYLAVSIHHRCRSDFVTDTFHHHLWLLNNGQFPLDSDFCMCGQYNGKSIPSGRWLMLVKDSMETKEIFTENIPTTSVVPIKKVLLDDISTRINAYKVSFEISSLFIKTGICIINRD